jgi:hypothetical protein
MFRKFTLGFNLVVGLALGLVISYFGLNFIFAKGLELLRRDAFEHFAIYEDQAIAMADDSLKLQPLLAGLGWRGSSPVFADIEKSRARMAGALDFTEIVRGGEDLEKALMDSARLWKEVGAKDKKISANFYWQEWGRQWNDQVRYLVKAEGEAGQGIDQYNRFLARWPVSLIAKGFTVKQALPKPTPQVERIRKGFALSLGRFWFGVRPVPVKESAGGGSSPDSHPKAAEPAVHYEALMVPQFVARAPLPEEDYDEVQYREDMPSMVPLSKGEEPPLLDREAEDIRLLGIPAKGQKAGKAKQD